MTRKDKEIFSNDSLIFWLEQSDNLVASLTKYCGKVTLYKHSQQLQSINVFERSLLKTPEAFVRQISLWTNQTQQVYARTVITTPTYNLFRKKLEQLDEKPIGDNFLYINKDFERSDFIVRKLTKEELKKEISLDNNHNIYSRTSKFSYKNTDLAILITEYFLNIDYLVGAKDNA